MVSPGLTLHLRRYLTTNGPPSHTDLKETRKILHLARSQFSDIRSGPERDELKRLISDCHVILSPQRRLPPEILRLIFLTCLPTAWEGNDPFADPPDPFHATQGSFNMRLVPWVLTRICSHWRNIALSTSALWSHLIICIGSLGHRHARNPFPVTEILQTQLQRSGTQPLSIIFTISRYSSRTLRDQIFPLLAAQRHRYQRLLLKANDSVIRRVLDADGGLPLLEHLQLVPISPNPTRSFEPINAPLLRNVRIQRARPLEHFQFPWSQITSFRGSHTHVRYILAHAPKLQELAGSIFGSAGEFVSQPPMAHTTLRRLELDVECLHAFGSLPSLLALHVSDAADIGAPSMVNNFILQTRCTLTFLSILDVRFSNGREACELLQVVPELKTLHIDDEISDHFLTALTCSGQPVLVPHLKVLVIIAQTPSLKLKPEPTLKYDHLLNMLQSRHRCSSRLQKVEYPSRRERLSKEQLVQTDAMRAEGLEITEGEKFIKAVPEYVMQ